MVSADATKVEAIQTAVNSFIDDFSALKHPVDVSATSIKASSYFNSILTHLLKPLIEVL